MARRGATSNTPAASRGGARRSDRDVRVSFDAPAPAWDGVSCSPPVPVLNDKVLWSAIFFLFALSAAAFFTAFDSDFVRWDDPDYIILNKQLKLGFKDGLLEFWNPVSKNIQQYYPFIFSSYWFEYHYLGAHDAEGNPTARVFHVTNFILHLINIALVMWLARKLGASRWLAIFVAAVFAVHPAQVASVLWVSERKNTMSGLFYCLALLAYMRHRRTENWWYYGLFLLAFLAGMLSKTQILGLPIAVFLLDAWQQYARRIKRRSMLLVMLTMLPLLLVGGVATKITTTVERRNGPSSNPASISTTEQRPLVVTAAAWHYVRTFLLPTNLAIVYERWKVPGFAELAARPLWLLAPLGWVVVLCLVAWQWRSIDPMIAWGVAQFFLIVGPALGIIPFNYQQYSFVADHFLYLATIGGALAVGRLIELWFGADTAPAAAMAGSASVAPPAATPDRAAATDPSSTPESPRRMVATGICSVLLLAAVVKSHIESRYWKENEVFWKRAIAKNYDCFPGNYNLGNHYLRQNPQQWDKARECYLRAHEIKPDNGRAFTNYLRAVLESQGPQAVINVAVKKLADPATHAKIRPFAEQAIREARDTLARKPVAPPSPAEQPQGDPPSSEQPTP